MAEPKPLTLKEIGRLRAYLIEFPPLASPPAPEWDVRRIVATLTKLSDRVDFLERENVRLAKNQKQPKQGWG